MSTQNINPNEESSQSQCKMIAAWLMQGKSITFPEALNLFGCARLASRINDLKNRGMNNISIKEECARELNWLKSLKGRIQPKQEWNEEEVENCAREAEDNNCIILAKHIRQLKSLRHQNAWKPSEEQMKLLREVQQALLGKDCHNRFVNFMYELKRLKDE